MVLLASVLSAALLIWATTIAWRRNSAFEALPSVAWLFMAVVPYAYLAQYFPPEAALTQGIGIALIALALAVGDSVAVFIAPQERELESGDFRQNLLLIGLIIIVVVIPVVHLIYARDVPFLHLFGDEEGAAEARENFSKLLEAPAVLKIMFNWVIVVAGPVLAASLFCRKRYVLFALVVTWCSGYAIISSARLPILLFAATTSVAIVAVSFPRFARPLLICGIVSLAGLNIGAIYRGEALMAGYERSVEEGTINPVAADRHTLPISPGDVERINGDQLDVFPTLGPLDSPLYRSFLGPMEVANRWYVFFPEVYGGWRPLTDLLPLRKSDEWQHASNHVGRWAYFERFPTRYLDSIHAYASVDADAFSFGGLWFVALAALGLLLIRILLAAGRVPISSSGVLYFVGVALMSALPFQASLQAMVIPNGLIAIFVGLLVTFVCYRRATGLSVTRAS